MFIQWDSGQQKTVGVPSNMRGESGHWYPYIGPGTRKGPAQTMVCVLDESGDNPVVRCEWVGSADPLEMPATSVQINARYRDLESAPIEVFDVLIDCDERAEARICSTTQHWGDLDLEPGVIELREIGDETVKVVLWTMGDNSVQEFTLDQLIAVRDEMLRKRAQRTPRLFSALRRFKADPDTTLRQIEDVENWLIPPSSGE